MSNRIAAESVSNGNDSFYSQKNGEFMGLDSPLKPAEIELPTPLDENALAARRVAAGFPLNPNVASKAVPEGIFLKGWDLEDSETLALLKEVLTDTVDIINSVPDEHFKPHGMIDVALLKQIWFELDDIDMKIYVCFRFTTDTCPAGNRMMSEVTKTLNQHYEEKGFNIEVEAIHGGSQWDHNNIQNEGLREAVSEIITEMSNPN